MWQLLVPSRSMTYLNDFPEYLFPLPHTGYKQAMKKKPLKYKDLSGETFPPNDPHERAHALNTLHVTAAVRNSICLAPWAMTPFSSTLSLRGYRELFLKNIVASRKGLFSGNKIKRRRVLSNSLSSAASEALHANLARTRGNKPPWPWVCVRSDLAALFLDMTDDCPDWESCQSKSKTSSKDLCLELKVVFPPKELVFCSVHLVLLPLVSVWFSLVCYDTFQQHTNNNRARFNKCVGWSEDFLKSYLFFFFFYYTMSHASNPNFFFLF